MPNIAEATPPPITWAQRSNCVFLTICLEDCNKPTIKLEKDHLFFEGVGGTEKKAHKINLIFYNEIDVEKSHVFARERNIEVLLKKNKDDEHYWPHLTKEKQKFHWLKVDFDKWRDEDDSEDEDPNNSNFEDIMRSMGGLVDNEPGAKPHFDLDAESDEDDDEELPELVD